MSFILDAIKQSEEQRQYAMGASLLAVSYPPDRETRTPLLLVSVIAVVLVLAGIAIGLVVPGHRTGLAPATPDTYPDSIAANTGQYDTPAPPAIETGTYSMPPYHPLAADLPAIPPQAPIHHKPKHGAFTPGNKTGSTPRRSNTGKRLHGEASAHNEAVKPAAVASVGGADTSKSGTQIYSLAELPTAIQREIPTLSVSGYSSSGKTRFVSINGQLLQEGDYLSHGLRLEHIDPDNLVFSYGSYYFRQRF